MLLTSKPTHALPSYLTRWLAFFSVTWLLAESAFLSQTLQSTQFLRRSLTSLFVLGIAILLGSYAAALALDRLRWRALFQFYLSLVFATVPFLTHFALHALTTQLARAHRSLSMSMSMTRTEAISEGLRKFRRFIWAATPVSALICAAGLYSGVSSLSAGDAPMLVWTREDSLYSNTTDSLPDIVAIVALCVASWCLRGFPCVLITVSLACSAFVQVHVDFTASGKRGQFNILARGIMRLLLPGAQRQRRCAGAAATGDERSRDSG